MAKSAVVIVWLCALMVASCGTPRAEETAPVPPTLDEIVALERAALDRWVRLDPQGYLDLDAPEITYFDPQREKRLDGIEAMKAMVAPIKDIKLPFTNPRYDMIDPHLQVHGDVALLTFNLVSYGTFPGKGEIVVARWNSSELYARQQGKWKIIHSHWSYTKPDLKPPAL